MKIRQFLFFALISLLLVVVAGCGGDHSGEAEAEAGTLYSLDPPELGLTVAPGFESGVPVLCYHYFRSGFDTGYLAKVFGSVLFGLPALGPREFWTTPAGEFEKHLRYFKESGTQVMTLDEVADAVAKGQPLPERAVVLTIDDADLSVYELAWPLLKKYNMRAHLFVPTAQVGKKWSELKVCTWEQLREMSASGHLLIGSHTRDLHFKVKTPDGLEPVFWNPEQVPTEMQSRNLGDVARHQRQRSLPALPDAAGAVLTGVWAPVAADLLASRYDIAANLNREPRWLAWPYGFAHGELDSISRLVGFRGTVSLEPLAFTDDDTLLTPGRYTLTAKTTLAMIKDVLPPLAP